METAYKYGKLVSSRSFALTHTAIAKLKTIEDFNSIQIYDLVEAALTNPQVKRILSDEDVYEFFSIIKTKYEEKIELDLLLNLELEIDVNEPLLH